ncbi:MAG: single-stranded DNA-binding protein [Zetaproteobacteria bacterium]|nr:MAG: single-stranded DNA-binding protein [Zetaproteobacteria bacterium]
MLNKVMLIGNLGADPETRFTQDGTCVSNIRVATTERFRNRDGSLQEHTEWHRVTLWGRLGEIARDYLRKGSRVYIEGQIRTNKWQDRDGHDRYTTEIRARDLKMLSGRNEAPGHQPTRQGGYAPQPATPPQPAAAPDPFADEGGFAEIPPGDDVPF